MSLLLFRSILRHRTPATWMLTTPARSFAAEQRKPAAAVTTASDRNDVSTDVRPIGERIKENTKTASYMGIIALGATVTGIVLFAVCRELLSSSSPNNVYSDALDRCINVRHLKAVGGLDRKAYILSVLFLIFYRTREFRIHWGHRSRAMVKSLAEEDDSMSPTLFSIAMAANTLECSSMFREFEIRQRCMWKRMW